MIPASPTTDARSLRFSALLAARNLQRFTLGDASPDIRGWHVISADRQYVGTVSRLIVEMRTRRVRYIVVALDEWLERRRRPSMNSVLVPVGLARRADECQALVLDVARADALQVAPRIPDRPITRDDEELTLAALGLPSLGEDGAPYAASHFDERRLLAPLNPAIS
jgi:hypothetical protein